MTSEEIWDFMEDHAVHTEEKTVLPLWKTENSSIYGSPQIKQQHYSHHAALYRPRWHCPLQLCQGAFLVEVEVAVFCEEPRNRSCGL